MGTNNPGTRVVQVGGGQTGYTATRLTNNDPYRFRVQAHNAVGWGPYGGAIPAQSAGKPAPMPVPSVPAEQSTSPQDQTVANVSWQPETDPNGPDVKAYSVYRKVGAGGYTVLANCRGLSRSTLNCVDTVQNDGTQYYYAVTAINGADIESTPTNGTLFLATGKPDQIQAVTVQASDNPGPGPQTDTGPGYNGAIHVTFAVPQPHGARITSVKYSLNGAPAGQWASPGSPGQQVTQTIGGLVNGQSYAVSLSACNEGNDGTNENCGQSSPDSNQVVPYGPPPTPSAGASNSGTVVTYSWGGGTNGRPVHFWVSLDGGPYQDRGTSGGSQQIDRGYSHNYSISVYVRDSAGQQSPTAGASGSTPPPPPVVTISWGGQAPPSGCQGDPTCTYITLAASGFSPGTHVVRWYDDFESGAWWTENINIGANGSGSLGRSPSRWFAYGFQHHSVWAVIDAVRSVNTLDSYGNPKVGQ